MPPASALSWGIHLFHVPNPGATIVRLNDVAVGLNGQGRFGEINIGQRVDRLTRSIPGFQFAAVAKIQCPKRTSCHTGRWQASIEVLGTERAFGHLTSLGIVLQRAVGTCPRAVLAANAFAAVDQYNAIVSLV
jgi:hypothetical protein